MLNLVMTNIIAVHKEDYFFTNVYSLIRDAFQVAGDQNLGQCIRDVFGPGQYVVQDFVTQ